MKKRKGEGEKGGRKTAEEDRLSLCVEIMLHCINSITPFVFLPMDSLYLILSRSPINIQNTLAIGKLSYQGYSIGMGSELRSEL